MSNARGVVIAESLSPSLRPIGAAYGGSMYSCGLTKRLHYLVRRYFLVTAQVPSRPYKPEVAGSKPAPPTNEIKGVLARNESSVEFTPTSPKAPRLGPPRTDDASILGPLIAQFCGAASDRLSYRRQLSSEIMLRESAT